jgi:hypothetical protein
MLTMAAAPARTFTVEDAGAVPGMGIGTRSEPTPEPPRKLEFIDST